MIIERCSRCGEIIYPTDDIIYVGLKFYHVICSKQKERYNMNDLIEITVKVNGVETPLYKISEQTLLTIRENSKPKEIPVARMADFENNNNNRRLILRMPHNIKNFKNQVVVIDLKSNHIQNWWSLNNDSQFIDCYENVRTIS